jgi:membrane-bound lytic murein transglycosylase D
MILAAIVIAKNPAQYGFDVTSAAPLGYEKVTLPRAMDLRRVAEWTETPINEIQALNPELRRWTTPVRNSSYEVKVPIGTGDRLRDRLATAKPGELAPLNWYRVKKGESIATIARKLNVSRTDLAEANALSTKSRVRAGQELIIPRAPATLLNARVDRPAPANAVSADASTGKADAEERTASSSAGRKTAASASAATADAGDDARVVYRVKRGDTLFSIARAFEVTVDALRSWNRLRGSHINPGDRLTIQTKNGQRNAQ